MVILRDGCWRYQHLALSETGAAILIVWTKVFEANRRTVLDAGMIGVRGRVQWEGEIVHLMAHLLTDLTKEFAGVGRSGRADDSVAD